MTRRSAGKAPARDESLSPAGRAALRLLLRLIAARRQAARKG